MNDDYKDLALDLAYKEIVFLRSELQVTDVRLRREIEDRMARAAQLRKLRDAVQNLPVLRSTESGIEQYRVHMSEEKWDALVMLARETE